MPRRTAMVYDGLRTNHRAVAAARRAPRVVEVRRPRRERELRGEFLVDVDTMAGRFVRDHVAVLLFRRAPEHFARFWREGAAFMDAEVVGRELQRELRGVRDRRGIARA